MCPQQLPFGSCCSEIRKADFGKPKKYAFSKISLMRASMHAFGNLLYDVVS